MLMFHVDVNMKRLGIRFKNDSFKGANIIVTCSSLCQYFIRKNNIETKRALFVL